MKSTVVPAQITTVEDKIAGSLNFIQIILLVFSLIIGTAFYGLIPPKLHLSSLKIILMIGEFAIFGLLALRYKGRILADWLVIYLRYKARPRIYIFTKNDPQSREQFADIKIMQKEKTPLAATVKKRIKKNKLIERPIIASSGSIVSIKPSKKGGFDVEYQEA
ncbi:MAG: PrgI family protein [Candidatus Berkelbacteria bacterium]|nr:PrgI family protein [Candidatus Berkelbacteria bacterium]